MTPPTIHPRERKRDDTGREPASGIFSGNLTCDAFYLLSSDSHSRLPVAFRRSFWLLNCFARKLSFPFGPRFTLRFSIFFLSNLSFSALRRPHECFCDTQFDGKNSLHSRRKLFLGNLIQLVKNRTFRSPNVRE